jgi:hypothetical protein
VLDFHYDSGKIKKKGKGRKKKIKKGERMGKEGEQEVGN